MTARLLALLAAACLAAPVTAQVPRAALEGYADWPSVRAGETLYLHLSSRAPSCNVAVLREDESALRWEAHELAVGEQAAPPGAPGVDCGWPVACEIPVAADWPSGPWRVRLTDPAGRELPTDVPFIVRPAAPASRVLVLAPFCTVQAYNTWGGASLYRGPDRPPVPLVTLRRPLAPADPYARHAAPGFDAWLRARGFVADFAADVDLQRDPQLLAPYDLLILPGHQEYWSAEMRAAVDAFVADGGRLLILGANTCYWQIRFEQDGTAIRCHKRADRDPLLATGDAHRVTSTWLGAPVLQPQERSLGLSWQHAGSTAPMIAGEDWTGWSIGGGPDRFPASEGFGVWRVVAPTHPDLASQGLPRGAIFGVGTLSAADGPHAFGACGGEVDGALTEELDGARPASTALGAPRNLLVLADAPAQEGLAAIAGFERYGEVLWCSSERLVASLTQPGAEVPDLARFVESAVRRLSRPRRNRLHGAGGHATLRGDEEHLLIAYLGAGAAPAVRLVADGGEVLATAHPVSRDGRVLAAWLPKRGHDEAASVEIEAVAGAAPVESVELLDHGLIAEGLTPRPAEHGATIFLSPTPGGSRLLVLLEAENLQHARLGDVDTKQSVDLVADQPGLILTVVDNDARGRMVNLALMLDEAWGPLRHCVLPLHVPSPPPAEPTAADRLIDDLYPNGGFEIAPTAPEIARGADWTSRPPRWASLAGPPPRLDEERAHSGHRSLRLLPGARVATHLGWPLTPGAAAVVTASVLAEAPDDVTLSVLAGPAGTAPPPELVRWHGGAPGAWVDAVLALPRDAVDGLQADAFLVVEAGAAGAWLDDLTFTAADATR